MRVATSPNGPLFGPSAQNAECYIVTLSDGTVIPFTDCDRTLTSVPVPGVIGGASPGTFTALRVKRGNIQWEAGTKPSSLKISIAVGPDQKVDLGLDWRIAAARGVLDWAEIKLWRAVGNSSANGNGLFTVNSDGTATPFLTVPVWFGYIASASIDRGKIELTCYDPRVLMNMMLPRYTYGALCRWTLYNPGDGAHGCPVNRSNYAIPTTVAAGSTRAIVQIPPLTGPAFGPPAPGWFDQGYVLGTGGNANQRATIRRYVPAIQNWLVTALGDGVVAFYPCSDPPGSHTLRDVSGNGYNGDVNGAVEFGQTTLAGRPLPGGMPAPYTTAVRFNNSPTGNAYITLPIPPLWQRPGFGGGYTFEWVMGMFDNKKQGLFDSAPSQNHALRMWSGPGTGQGTGGGGDLTGEWAQQTFAPVPAYIVPAHWTVVFRGTQTVEVYNNGIFANSVTTGGPGIVAWGTGTSYGGQDGPFTLGRVEPDDDLGSAPNIEGAFQYYDGYLFGFGVYDFPFSPAQVLAHANAALTTASSSSTATLYLVDPLPNTPNLGDVITLYPGCNLTYPTCVKKFGKDTKNGLFFGGFPGVPDAETSI